MASELFTDSKRDDPTSFSYEEMVSHYEAAIADMEYTITLYENVNRGHDEGLARLASLYHDQKVPRSFYQLVVGDLGRYVETNTLVIEVIKTKISIIRELISHETIIKSEEIYVGELNRAKNRRQAARWSRHRQNLQRIFPASRCEVNIPQEAGAFFDEELQFSTVGAWQRQKRLRPNEADTAYLSFTASARENLDELCLHPAEMPEIEYLEHISSLTEEEVDNIQVMAEANFFPIDTVDEAIAHNAGWSLAEPVAMPVFGAEGGASITHHRPNDVAINRAVAAFRKFISWYEYHKSTMFEELAKRFASHLANELADEWDREVDEVYYDLLQSELRALQAKFREFEARGEGTDDKKRTKQKVGRAVAAAADVGEVLCEEPSITARIPAELLPWLEADEQESREVKIESASNGSRVGFVDGRNNKAKEIQAVSFDEKDGEAVIDVVERRIKVAVNRTAADCERTMSMLRHVDKERYPMTIYCPKVYGSNAERAYFGVIPSDTLTDGPLKNELQTKGIEKVVLLLGACTKQHQIDMLKEFTTQTTRSLRNHKVGSI